MQVVDTTGAGDTFTAAFAVALLEGLPAQQALAFACAPPMHCTASCVTLQPCCALVIACAPPHALHGEPCKHCPVLPLRQELTGYLCCSCSGGRVCAATWGHAQRTHASGSGGHAAEVKVGSTAAEPAADELRGKGTASSGPWSAGEVNACGPCCMSEGADADDTDGQSQQQSKKSEACH